MNQIPVYIADRIRNPPPVDCHVVKNSPPIVSFGNAQASRIATLGLNPSYREISKGHVRSSFGRLEDALDYVIEAILTDQYTYFDRQGLDWFFPLEVVLNECGVSYRDSSACHLDLCQWATDPVWSRLSSTVKRKLLRDGLPFLSAQLQNENIETLLVNGSGVSKELVNHLPVVLTKAAEVSGVPGTPRIGSTILRTGQMLGRIFVIEWNVNLQGTHGMSAQGVKSIAKAVGAVYRERNDRLL